MTVGILTSSRADFGIYLPLLRRLCDDTDITLRIIAFGTHLSPYHGYTVDGIREAGFDVDYTVESLLATDSPNAIATAYSLTALKFADFWKDHRTFFDVVFALGDRYEMAAAVAATIPFQVKIAHLHGGETTLGAIDNIYRNSISLASSLHFVAAEPFRQRLYALLGSEKDIYTTGSLSLENIHQLELLSLSAFNTRWGIDLSVPTLLVTVHPETVAYQENIQFAEEVNQALSQLVRKYQIVVTLPNADTAGTVFRTMFSQLKQQHSGVVLIENFGSQSYFTCMKYAKLLLGNTSSGIIEAASFGKYVINVGNRQQGRMAGDNVIHVPFDSKGMIAAVERYVHQEYSGPNPYWCPNPSASIIAILKTIFA